MARFGTVIHSLPGKLEVSWIDEVKAILDTWSTYSITLEEFSDSVLVRGLKHARENKGQAWIVDSSSAKGVFSAEIQDFIGTDIFPSFAKNGIKYFITINSETPVTRLTVKTYQAKAGPHGLKLVEVDSVDDAIEWLKKNS